MKKVRRSVLWFSIIVVFIYLLPKLVFEEGFNYRETLSTKYIAEDTTKIISTQHFIIETPKDWFHIFHCYGEEGEAVGSFITKYGLLKYEYGMFSSTYNIDSIFVFKRDSLIVNRFEIFIGHNNTNEIGIYIPKQHEMEWPFSFFMSQPCKDNKADIIEGIKHMKFKKFYNISRKQE